MIQGAAETSENGEQDDADDFSEYRKSIHTYVDHNFKTGGVISSPLLNKPINNSEINHITGEFEINYKKNPIELIKDCVIDET
jgi:hypothetical protein